MSYELFDVLVVVVAILLVFLAPALTYLFTQSINRKRRLRDHSITLVSAVRGLARLSFSGEALGFKMNRDPRNPAYSFYKEMEQHLDKNYPDIWTLWIDVAEQYDRVEKKIKRTFDRKQEGKDIENDLEAIRLDRKALLKRYEVLQREVKKVGEGIDAGGILKGKCDICKEF